MFDLLGRQLNEVCPKVGNRIDLKSIIDPEYSGEFP